MKLRELVSGLEILDSKGDMEIEVADVAYDSRKVREGSVFACIKGTKVDGHDFIPSALQNGAAALVVQKHAEPPEGVAVIRVGNTRFALAYMSDTLFGHPSRKFNLIGVTGTKGKTTTTFMIKSILEHFGQKVGLIGTVANFIGNRELHAERTTPESYDLQSLFAEMAADGVGSVVMEVSSHALDLHRVSCSDYDIGIFTNLSRDHLDYHKTFENYFDAKLKLFKMCRKGLANIDSEYGRKLLDMAACPMYTYAVDRDADIRAVNIRKLPDSVEFKVTTPWWDSDIKVNVPGMFSVYNALAAIGACGLSGIPAEFVKAGLSNISVPGRAEVINTGRDFTIIIDYAHSPDSLDNILKTVKDYAPGRLVSVFGCGGDRDKTKRPIMGEISGRIADFTIITSDNPRTEEPSAIISDIEAGMKRTDGRYITIVERREAIRHAIENAQPKDIIVLAGKGHETYQIFKDRTIHFDEREVVREILDESGGQERK